MIKSTFQKRIHYAETDKMGYLYYGHYAKLYEIGRGEMMREKGFTYRTLEDGHKIMMPVVKLECRYKQPAYYDDLITIHSAIREMPTKLITFHHEIRNEEDILLNTGIVKLFFIDMATGNRISCPEILQKIYKPYFE